jgi:hypothetical protein
MNFMSLTIESKEKVWQFDFIFATTISEQLEVGPKPEKDAGCSDGKSPQQKARRVCKDVCKRGKTVPCGCD